MRHARRASHSFNNRHHHHAQMRNGLMGMEKGARLAARPSLGTSGEGAPHGLLHSLRAWHHAPRNDSSKSTCATSINLISVNHIKSRCVVASTSATSATSAVGRCSSSVITSRCHPSPGRWSLPHPPHHHPPPAAAAHPSPAAPWSSIDHRLHLPRPLGAIALEAFMAHAAW